ncbi:Uncharacterized protein Fot_57714 [Forsythia ovata]|uniref:Uncharacterized protein n=1 Tax=Forsythia ovata TaxID=205694 RepID=A0ABD1NUY9_9LAMI
MLKKVFANDTPSLHHDLENQGFVCKAILPRGIDELVRPEVMWGEILRQRRFDFRVGQIFTEILLGSVLGVGLLALPQVPATCAHPSIYNPPGQGASDTGGGFRLRDFLLKQKL